MAKHDVTAECMQDVLICLEECLADERRRVMAAFAPGVKIVNLFRDPVAASEPVPGDDEQTAEAFCALTALRSSGR